MKHLVAETTIKIPFHDVDDMSVVWHGHYLKYFEVARCELLELFNFGYPQMSGTKYAWPVIDVHIRYIKPAVFGQEIKVIATLGEIEHRLKINYLIEDASTGERLTKGHTIQVAVNTQTREMCLVSPDVLYERLGIER